jgi:3-hydroxyisobutyrate dehydrogenase-like beta-hydroxyacid dehydrogenase
MRSGATEPVGGAAARPLTVAVLGLGEAGSAIATDIGAAGARVVGFDPRPEAGQGIARAESLEQAVAGADVVLSVNSAEAALPAARSALEALRSGQLFADLNSAGAPLKQELAALIEPSGALFADVALMAPVPGRGLRTPALVSGPGAEMFADRLGALGMPVEVVGGEPGQAAVRKLLRSVFMKGLAAAAIEALSAAAAAGCEDWLREEIARALTDADAALLERLETGTRKHAARRAHEVEDASALLHELGVEPRVSEASAGWLKQLGN